MEVLFVIRQKNCQTHKNQQRVTGKCARLQKADGEAEELRQLGAEVQQAVNDPLVPPHGKLRRKAREPASAVHADSVDDFGIELAEQRANIFRTVHEQGVVNFVNVIFVDQHSVEAAHSSSDQFRSESLGAVELVRQPDASDRRSNGGEHQEIFCWPASLFLL